MSSEPAGAVTRSPGGRLVFDCSSEADTAVADRLHDTLFPTEPADRRRSLYYHQTGDQSPASEGGATAATVSRGEGHTSSGDRSEEAPDGSDAVLAEPWPEDVQGPPQEPFSPAALRVLERRRLIRQRFARRQQVVRQLQRRCGQQLARGAPVWSPPVLVYRPPPLATLQRRLLEPGQLADTVPEPAGRTLLQIQEFSDRHLRTGTEDDTPR